WSGWPDSPPTWIWARSSATAMPCSARRRSWSPFPSRERRRIPWAPSRPRATAGRPAWASPTWSGRRCSANPPACSTPTRGRRSAWRHPRPSRPPSPPAISPPCCSPRRRGPPLAEDGRKHIQGLLELPRLMEQALEQEAEIAELAKEMATYKNFLFLGRGIHYPIALEGALKLKELSYLHAEGYPAGEMKHGPIALIDDGMPVVALTPRDASYERMMNTVEEVRARDGRIIALAHEGDREIAARSSRVMR